MYVANHYVKVNGKRYVAGEILPDDMPQEKINWLMSAGAIHRVGPAAPVDEALREETSNGQNEEDNAAGEETQEEEIDDEAEAPEIDVTAGLVTDGGDDEKPKRGGRGKAK